MSPFERPTDASEPGNSPTGRATGRPEQATPISAGQGALGAEYGHERLSLFASSSRGSTLGPAPGARNPRVTLQRSQTDRRRGAGSQGLRELLGRLSARDISLIDLLAEHRFLTTRHMQAFCFHDHATLTSASRSARRVLGRLAREDLIESPARRVGGMEGGSDAYVWQLTAVGQRLRASRAGLGASTRVRTPSARFIEHYLAIADVRLQLVDAERRGLLTSSQVQIEPLCWQRYTGMGGSNEVLKPDLAAITIPKQQDEFEDHWFIEVDRATESIPTVLRQCRAYEACRQSGAVQAERGVFPIVVWVVPTQRRADNIARGIRQARGLDAELYRVCTYEELLPPLLGGAA